MWIKGRLKSFSFIIACCAALCTTSAYADDANVLNVYVWSGEVSYASVQQFEKETGIKVNFSTYDSNETLYAKLKASKNPGYDIIEPTNYYVDRMRREGMLLPIDKSKLSNYGNLDPDFLNRPDDPGSHYSIPFMWGTTALFVNTKFFPNQKIDSWGQLWGPGFKDQVMIIDDTRQAFSMALMVLGYSANDTNPAHIKQAYLKLKELMPNIRVFTSDGVASLMADDDAPVGMAWNGDAYNAQVDNSSLQYIYPKEGFVVWVDCFAIPKGAPHLENAYKFLNFMMRPQVAAQSTIENNYAVANLPARKYLPPAMVNNPIIFPSSAILARGQFQTDVSDQALNLYNYYWQLLKVGG